MPAAAQRVAIIGAGPIGLEAALRAADCGFEVAVFERGRISENVLRWGHVRMFSPFGFNSSERGRSAIAATSERTLPEESEILTGRQFAERYLIPLSQTSALAACIHEQTEVMSISRKQHWKGDSVGQQRRLQDPFQLLIRDAAGEEYFSADFLIDCSGTYGHHNWVGAGGMPCVGERSSLTGERYTLPDILGTDRARFAGKRTLIVGAGYSAATAAVSLSQLAQEFPQTRAVWITRSDRSPPMPRIADDALPERDRLADRANRIALSDDGVVEWRRAQLIQGIRRCGPKEEEQYAVTVKTRVAQRATAGALTGSEELTVDRVIANVGYRPDRQLYEELQVHECYATEGPMKLAAALIGESLPDCLAQSSHGVESLRNPEPGLFILGAKSYGRDARFLIRIGLSQIDDLFASLQSTVDVRSSATGRF